MMAEVCGATNCIMMEVGGATSIMMKMRGATKSNLRNYKGNFHLCGNRYETVYFMMR